MFVCASGKVCVGAMTTASSMDLYLAKKEKSRSLTGGLAAIAALPAPQSQVWSQAKLKGSPVSLLSR